MVHDVLGDFTSDERWCAPGHTLGGDGRPGCPESVGIMGVKYQYHGVAFPEAAESTAYNLDYTLAVVCSCFDGQESWLADNPVNSGYRAGDLWGCLGRWYEGDWRSASANGYIGRVQAAMNSEVWKSDWFVEFQCARVGRLIVDGPDGRKADFCGLILSDPSLGSHVDELPHRRDSCS